MAQQPALKHLMAGHAECSEALKTTWDALYEVCKAQGILIPAVVPISPGEVQWWTERAVDELKAKAV